MLATAIVVHRFDNSRASEPLTYLISDSDALQGLNHNFIKPHMALNGKTPAEIAGIKVEGKNKWLTLIQQASVSGYNSQ